MRGAAQNRVLNFREGGLVGGGGNTVTNNITPGSATGGNTQVNVPINIEGGGNEQPSINVRRMKEGIKKVVQEEMRQSKRPKGENY